MITKSIRPDPEGWSIFSRKMVAEGRLLLTIFPKFEQPECSERDDLNIKLYYTTSMDSEANLHRVTMFDVPHTLCIPMEKRCIL